MGNFLILVIVTVNFYTLVQIYKALKHVRADVSRIVTRDEKDKDNASA